MYWMYEAKHYFCCRCGEELDEDEGQDIDGEVYCDWCAENFADPFDEEDEEDEEDDYV